MRQLIYASVPSGLAPGRSGYCTAARSPGLRERLVREVELISAHELGEGESYAFNLISVSGETFAVLTRFTDAGPDYTGRASTLAHHLVFESRETTSLPPPADIARRFTGWLDRWEGPPRHLDDGASPALAGAPATLPAVTWKRLAGDAGKASLYCDESGRAKPGTLPAPGGADTLALLAEASLLLDDRGWTNPFTTRLREPDNWAVWRASPATSPTALPEPGLTRRATLARSGVLPGVRPGAAKPPGSGRATHPVYNDAGAAGNHPTGLTTFAILAGGTTLAALALVAFLLLRGGSDADGTPPPEPPVRPVLTPAPVLPPTNPHVTAALKALDEGNPVVAASEWLALKAASPAEADAHRADILNPVRARLLPETLARLANELSGYTAPAPEAVRARIAAAVAEARRLAGLVGAPKTPEDDAAEATVSGTLALMARADAAIPDCAVVAPEWSKVNETPVAVTTATPLGESPELAAFLAEPHAALRVSVAPFAGFDKKPAPAFSVEIPARDFVAGRILAVKHPEQNLLLEFSFDARKRLSLSRRHPLAAPAAFRILGADTPVAIALEDRDTGRAFTLILSGAENAPAGLALPASLLVEKNGAVTVPGWVAGLAGRVRAAGAKPALLPSGYNGAPRDFPGLEAGRAVVEQALRARLAEFRAKAGPAPEIARAERALAGLSTGKVKAVAAGAPWSIVIAPPGVAGTLPILRFE